MEADNKAENIAKLKSRIHRVGRWLRAQKYAYLLTGQTHESEFLPAALEIVETPPRPAGRIIAFLLMAFFTLALLWACIGTVDIIATASGKIVPTGRTKIIQPLESGVVHAIHVQDGEEVKAGQILVEIDTTISASERDRLKNDYMQAMLDTARLKAALQMGVGKDAEFIAPEGATDTQIALQKTMLTNMVDGIHAKLADLDHQIAQNEGNRDAVQSTIAKLTESIPYLEKRAEARKYLLDKGYGSKLDYLTTQQDLIEHQQELKVQTGRLAEAEGEIAAHKDQRRQAEDEYKHDVLKDLAEAEQKSTSLHEQFLQAAQKYRLQTLTAPVDGTVQQLAVHTNGGVVTPAQVLMSIVPADSHLEIEAMVSNKTLALSTLVRKPRSKSTPSTSPVTASSTAKSSPSRKTPLCAKNRRAKMTPSTIPVTKAIPANQQARSSSIPPAYHLTKARCRSTTAW